MQLLCALFALVTVVGAKTVANKTLQCMQEKIFESTISSKEGKLVWDNYIKPNPKNESQANTLIELFHLPFGTHRVQLEDFREECLKEPHKKIANLGVTNVLTAPKAVNQDQYLIFPQLVTKYGYPIEEYSVTTEDGYILKLYRIPHGKAGQPSTNKTVVFLMHGLLSSSDDWIITGVEKGLGYILADAGYDVWLGNARGNRYSFNHTKLDLNSKKYWDFSWHEIGTIDLPAMIDFTLEKSGQKSVYYIGHSQGTTSFYVMCSERPAYNDKIKGQFSLAPIAYMSHMTSPLLKAVSLGEGGLEIILNLMGMNEFLPTDSFLNRIAQTVCDTANTLRTICTNSLFVMTGFDNAEFNTTLLPILMGHTPAGSSTKQLLHYGQEIKSGEFRQFDYGLLVNPIRYGSLHPPKYNLSKVTAPVNLFYSSNDWLSAEKDVLQLAAGLANVKNKILVADSKWNHLDYMYGIDAYKFVYKKVISLMAETST